MDCKDILQKIIDESGSCCWAKPSICKQCPLSVLRQRKDGAYMSCIESLGANSLSEEEADGLYKTAAERMLLGLEIDDLLTDEDEV